MEQIDADHIVPSGLMNPNCQNLIGSGVVVHVPSFFKELEDLEQKGLVNVRERIFISVSHTDQLEVYCTNTT